MQKKRIFTPDAPGPCTPPPAHQYMHMYTHVNTHIQTYFMYRHSNLGIWRNSRGRLNVQSTIKKTYTMSVSYRELFWRTLMPQICIQHTQMAEAPSVMIPLIRYLKHTGVMAIRSPIHPCYTHTNRLKKSYISTKHDSIAIVHSPLSEVLPCSNIFISFYF